MSASRSAARGRWGADVVIAVDVASEMGRFEDHSGLDIVLRADAVTRVYLNDILLQEADVIIHPDVGARHWADFSNPGSCSGRGKLPGSKS